jgi:divalent metal cation (Fe/Co/Zn/Cd) transporter
MPLPLLERSEQELAQMIRKQTEAVKGVKEVRQVNVRTSGKRLEVSMHVLVDKPASEAMGPHALALRIEDNVKRKFPSARISINTEPAENGRENIWRLVKEVAEAEPGSRGVHSIHIQKIGGKLCIDLHLEVGSNLTVKQAHDVSENIERKIRVANANISEVTIHIESASEQVSREMAGVKSELQAYIQDLAKEFPEIKSVYGIRISRFGNVIHVVLRSRFDSKLKIGKAHEISTRFERAIRTAYPTIARIDIHEEPAN